MRRALFRILFAGLYLLGAGLSSAAHAQGRAYDDPESKVVADVVIVMPGNGPAWWKVSKGDAVAWVLALPPALAPRDLQWDKTLLERRMKGARAL